MLWILMIPFGVHEIPDPTERDFFVEEWTKEFEQSGEWERVGGDPEPKRIDYNQYIDKTVGGILAQGNTVLVVYKGTLLSIKNGSLDYQGFPILAGTVQLENGNVIEVRLDPYDKIFFVHKKAPAASSSPSTSSENVGGSGGNNSVRGM